MQAGNGDYRVSKAGVLAFHEGLAQKLKFRYQAPKVCTSFVSTSPYFPTLNLKSVIYPSNILTPAFLPHSSQPHYKNQLITSPQTVAKAVVKQIHSGRTSYCSLDDSLSSGEWDVGVAGVDAGVREEYNWEGFGVSWRGRG
jgi:hypothetical protein